MRVQKLHTASPDEIRGVSLSILTLFKFNFLVTSRPLLTDQLDADLSVRMTSPWVALNWHLGQLVVMIKQQKDDCQ